MSIGDYYAQTKGLWRGLELYQPISTDQEKDVENQCIYELVGGVNLEYKTTRAQVLSQDPLPSISTM